jgi:DNA-binding CsgD family transcriptional regulator
MNHSANWLIREPDGPWGVAGQPPPVLPATGDDLSPAELNILACLAQGMTNAEIARQRGSSPATVRNQLHQLFSKLGARTRGQAVAIWWQRLGGSALQSHLPGE